MTAKIPMASPLAQYLALRPEIDAAMADVLAKGVYVHGAQCAAFETEIARWLGIPFALGVANGTDALRLALTASGVEPGAEVIVPSHTAVATVAAVELAGARPVFVDVESEGLGIDPAAVEAAITPRTRAVIAVHLYGYPAEVVRLRELRRSRGLVLIEDCAQAIGATIDGRQVGTFGDLAAFSFYPTKNLGALGDGGLITTADGDVAERCRRLREYGWQERFVSQIPGGNSRLDELQAAVLRVKLRHLRESNERRRRIAAAYSAAFAPLSLKLPPGRPGLDHAYHLYVVRHTERDRLREGLRERGIDTGIHYPMPVHRQPAYRDRAGAGCHLPCSDQAAREVLTLPLYPELSDPEIAAVIDAVRDVLREMTPPRTV